MLQRTMEGYSPPRTILLAGSICGFLDALSAIAVSGYFGVKPERVFQGIASGWLGRSAFQGGIASALLGLAFHLIIAFGAATVYYFASRSFPALLDRVLLSGVGFGVAVHLFMTFIVIPLSAIGRRPLVLKSFVIYLIVSMIVVGPSISLSVRRFFMR